MDHDERSVQLVRADRDRFDRERRVFGTMRFSVKVTSADSGDGLFVLEQHNAFRGGPPRHPHHDQEEWFYVVAGHYAIEVDGARHELGPGDALLAPRGVPHTWALVGNAPGRMIVAFSPAGAMEAFFDEASEARGLVTSASMRELFARHGMLLTGAPLEPDATPPADDGRGDGGQPPA